MKRVVITGLGVVSAIGLDVSSFCHNLFQGCSGSRRVTGFDTKSLQSSIAAQIVDFDPARYFGAKKIDLLDRFSQFALVAAREAVADARLKLREKVRFGVSMGTTVGGISTLLDEMPGLYFGTRLPKPFTIPMMMNNAAAGNIALEFGARGPCLTVSTACSSSNDAIGLAFRMIKYGQVDVMLAGGSEAPICYGALAAWESLGLLAKADGDPARACRPFSLDRTGIVIGEGAGVVLLEELEHAFSRNAGIYAEICGYGTSCDAEHITYPTVDSPVQAMKLALKEAKIAPEQVTYINAHGTGTPFNDALETYAVKDVFKEIAYKIPISSTKSMHGHVLGATGGVELVACVLAIKHQMLPPTANYSAPDPECDLDYVPNESRQANVDVVMSNSFAFGGISSVLIIKRFN